MSEIIKCPSCGGFKQVRGCGHMLEKCKRCNALGFITIAADEPKAPPITAKAEGSVFTDQYHETPAEAPAKKRGRPKAVLNV